MTINDSNFNTVSPEVSQRLRYCSILAMMAVLILHGNTVICNTPNATTWNRFVQELLYINCTNWAVPLFFAISGYLCVFSCQKYKSVLALYKRKGYQLLIPYLLWCIYGTFLLGGY